MKLRSTVWMALALGALCALYWAVQWRGAREERRALEAKRVFNFEPEAVRSLEIRQLGEGPTAAAKDQQGKWRITKPNPEIEPFEPMWGRVAKTLALLESERTLFDRLEDPAAYGLSDPALTVSAQTAAGEDIALAFGSLDPTENYRYAQLNGRTVFLVTKTAYFELNRSLSDLRRRFLVQDREAPLIHLEFARIWTQREAEKQKMEHPPAIGEESLTMVVERDGGDAPWRMAAPVEAPADQEAVKALADAVQFGLARDFIDVPEDLRDYGLLPPSVRITVIDARENLRQTLFIGDSATGAEKGPKGIYAKWEHCPAVFLVDPDFVTKFPASPDAFRDRHLLLRAVSDIHALEYLSSGEAFRIEKHPEQGWTMVRPAFADVDQLALSWYLGMLKEATAIGFTDRSPAECGLDSPEVTLTLSYTKGASEGVIRIAPNPADENLYYGTQDTGVVVLLDALLASRIKTSAATFRSRELLRFPKADAVKLEFRFDAIDYVFEKVHGRWVIRRPENASLANQSDVDMLINGVNPMTGRAEPDPNPDLAAYGLDVPRFKLVVTTRPADDPARETQWGPIAIGNVTVDDSQRRYATAAGREGVFRVSQSVIEAVREALRGVQTP